ncbi:MAG: hypothetical protein ACYC7G_10960 [Rudaea sp.]
MIGIFVVEIENDWRSRIVGMNLRSALILAAAASAPAAAAARARRFFARGVRMLRCRRRGNGYGACGYGYWCRTVRCVCWRQVALGTLRCGLLLRFALLLCLLGTLALRFGAHIVLRQALFATRLRFVATVAYAVTFTLPTPIAAFFVLGIFAALLAISACRFAA